MFIALLLQTIPKSCMLTTGAKSHNIKLRACWGKHAAKNSVCMGIKCQIISVKFKFSNICELKTHDTSKNVAMLESAHAIVLFLFCFSYIVCPFFSGYY